MMKWTGVGREAAWGKVFIMAFMVIAVIFAYSAYTIAQDDIPINIKVKAKDGTEKMLRIKIDPKSYELKEAKVDGKDNTVTITGPQRLPITFEHIRGITEIRGGSVIVFDSGSICIPIPDGHGGYYWIGYPPGTQCP